MTGTPKVAAPAKAMKSPAAPGVVETMKEFLAEDRHRIKLDDYVTGLLKDVLATLAADTFWTAAPTPNGEVFQGRLDYYEATTKNLLEAAVLIARWGRADQTGLLGRILSRLTEPNQHNGGYTAWASGRYYPASLISYGAGITAIAFGNYGALRQILLTNAVRLRGENGPDQLAVIVADEVNQLSDDFKELPDHARNPVPRNEYMFKKLRPTLEDLLFLGSSYEQYFDEFEMLSSLAYADIKATGENRVWAAPGRFGWKSAHNGQPYGNFVKQATAMGASWPVLKEGFFNSSPERFQEIAKRYAKTLSEMNLY